MPSNRPFTKGNAGKTSRQAAIPVKSAGDLLKTVDIGKSVKHNTEILKQLTEKIWLPFIEDIMAVDAQVALQLNKDGAEARSRIYQYLFGKPTEQRHENTPVEIKIGFVTIEKKEDIPRIQQHIIDGEYTILTDNTQISLSLPKPDVGGVNEPETNQTAPDQQNEVQPQSGESIVIDASEY